MKDGAGHDPLVERVELRTGCSVVFTLGLSDLAAVRIHNERVFPVKSAQVRDIEDVILQVQRLMSGTPPLWLRRVLRDATACRPTSRKSEADSPGLANECCNRQRYRQNTIKASLGNVSRGLEDPL